VQPSLEDRLLDLLDNVLVNTRRANRGKHAPVNVGLKPSEVKWW
jgi:hypothetical protein